MQHPHTNPLRPRWLKWIGQQGLLGLALFTTAGALLLCLGNELAWDDQFFINELAARGGSFDLWQVITQPFWDNSASSESGEGFLWRPLTSLVLRFPQVLFGVTALPYRIVSLLCLGACAAGLFAVLARFGSATKTNRPTGNAARLLVLCFAAHPFAAEVLCLASNAADHLAGAFMLLQTAWLADRFTGKRSPKNALPVVALLGLSACLSKELGVLSVFTPLLAAGIISTGEPIFSRRMIPCWLAAILPVGLYFSLRSAVIGSVAVPSLFDVPEYSRLVLAGVTQLSWRAVGPIPTGTHLSIAESGFEAVIAIGIGGALLLAAGITSVRRLSGQSFMSGTFIGAGGMLALSLLSVDIGSHWIPLRYFHLPYGLLLIGLYPVIARYQQRRLFLPLGAVYIILLSGLSFVRVSEWQNPVTLWQAERHYHPTAAYPVINLAAALNERRAFSAAEQVLQSINPDTALSPPFRAKILCLQADIITQRDGNLRAAEQLLTQALTLWPGHLDGWLSLAETKALADSPAEAIGVLERARTTARFTPNQHRRIDQSIQRYRSRAGETSH